MIKDVLEKYKEVNVALYGLGTETERFINDYGFSISISGLLDGFRTDGELYGYPIIPIADSIAKGIKLIILIAAMVFISLFKRH